MRLNTLIATLFLFKVVFSFEMKSVNQRSIGKITSVVNLELCRSCLTESEKESKETYKEVVSYAELKYDPRADLPSAFTICSSAMTTYAGDGQMFFNILGKDGNSWLQPVIYYRNEQTTFLHKKWADVKLPWVFSRQWTRSCVAIDTESGLLQ